MIDLILDNLGFWLIIPLFILVFYTSKHVHKHEKRYYMGALLISFIISILVILDQRTSASLRIPIIQTVVVGGNLSFALFVLVMFAGAINGKSNIKTNLVRVRREMALIGFIFLIPHAIFRMSLALAGYNTTGLVAFIIMIPLVITSALRMMKKMSVQNWKKVHRIAYVAYFFIYLHLAFRVFFISGSMNITQTTYAYLYHLLFLFYLVLKIAKVVNTKQKKPNKRLQQSS
jgi:methionine sulfoxide reductase heme-binding subunit